MIHEKITMRLFQILAHTIDDLNGFGKSNPQQNRQLIVLISSRPHTPKPKHTRHGASIHGNVTTGLSQSATRNRLPLGPYGRSYLEPYGGPGGGRRFLMSEVPLYHPIPKSNHARHGAFIHENVTTGLFQIASPRTPNPCTLNPTP